MQNISIIIFSSKSSFCSAPHGYSCQTAANCQESKNNSHATMGYRARTRPPWATSTFGTKKKRKNDQSIRMLAFEAIENDWTVWSRFCKEEYTRRRVQLRGFRRSLVIATQAISCDCALNCLDDKREVERRGASWAPVSCWLRLDLLALCRPWYQV